MANLRTGSYGSYYGSFKNESSPLSKLEMQANATYIRNYLSNKGWSLNSICAILGNMQAESSINPGRWQADNVGVTALGYGLVQWTPSTNYTEWATSNGFDDYSEMDTNLARIVYEVENNLQWIKTDVYPITFDQFATGKISFVELPLYYLTEAFLINYERPADQSNSVKEYRTSLANYWFNYLNGSTPNIPVTPTKTKRKHYNFLLFNARKRRNEWIK